MFVAVCRCVCLVLRLCVFDGCVGVVCWCCLWLLLSLIMFIVLPFVCAGGGACVCAWVWCCLCVVGVV